MTQRRANRGEPLLSTRPRGRLWIAWAACAVGLLYAAVSVYWGAGGTWLVDTIGGSLARLGRTRDPGVMAAVWAAAALKVAASVVPLPAVRDSDNRTPLVRVLAWIAAVILTVYGALLTTVGLLVQADVIHQSASADHRALAWHAYLWDPWFLIWGVLIASALVCSRNRQASTAGARNRGGDVRQASTSAYDDIAHARSAN